jgi:hypothetical protein
MTPPIDPLDELLDRCRAAPEPPAQLAAEVYRRIAQGRPTAPPTWVRRLDAACARPSFALAFVASCVLLGLFLAEARLERVRAAQSAQIARSYLELIDPLLKAPEAPPPSASHSP